jgi:hypothetical protein
MNYELRFIYYGMSSYLPSRVSLQDRISKHDVVLQAFVIGDMSTTLEVKGFKYFTLSKWRHVEIFQNCINYTMELN